MMAICGQRSDNSRCGGRNLPSRKRRRKNLGYRHLLTKINLRGWVMGVRPFSIWPRRVVLLDLIKYKSQSSTMALQCSKNNDKRCEVRCKKQAEVTLTARPHVRCHTERPLK